MGAVAISSDASAVPAHSSAYRTRRFLNWFPLGLSYALLYMGRYNLTVSKNALGGLMTNEDFGIIFGAGTVVYAFAFLLNGPLTDKIGGKKAMLVAMVGAGLANLLMGLYIQDVVASGSVNNATLRSVFSLLYTANMYFQSFGAVAIVKVNASWFHVRERGGFSGIFGTMISSGIFLAFTVNALILSFAAEWSGVESETPVAKWVFFVPAALLFLFAAVESVLLKDRPSEAGHEDFDTGDASSGDSGDVPMGELIKRILTNPIILTVGLIEFCTGVVRQSVMQWYPIYAKSVLALPANHGMMRGSWGDFTTDILPFFLVSLVFFVLAKKTSGARKGWLYASAGLVFLIPFLQGGWGGILMVAGVIGGNVAGYVSDLFFQSRRAPAAGGLYGFLFVCAVAMAFVMGEATSTVAESKVVELLPGDRILEVAGKPVSDWPSVAAAFAAVPAQCKGGAEWDTSVSMCSTSPKKKDPSLAASNGVIAMVVERAGARVEVAVKDPSPAMRAGDQRVLKAVPKATRNPYALGVVVFLMSLCVIGTHGLLSGTATMDFGGKKGAATAVGMIDGFVYLGTAVQSVSLGYLTQKDWTYWPYFMMPFALVGFLLCLRIWNAKPRAKAAPAASGAAAPAQKSA